MGAVLFSSNYVVFVFVKISLTVNLKVNLRVRIGKSEVKKKN